MMIKKRVKIQKISREISPTINNKLWAHIPCCSFLVETISHLKLYVENFIEEKKYFHYEIFLVSHFKFSFLLFHAINIQVVKSRIMRIEAAGFHLNLENWFCVKPTKGELFCLFEFVGCFKSSWDILRFSKEWRRKCATVGFLHCCLC